MSSEDVVDECKIFCFAGQDTTSSLLTWTMSLLVQYPDWQARAREEVVQVFGNKKPDFDGLNHLKVVSISMGLSGQQSTSTKILNYGVMMPLSSNQRGSPKMFQRQQRVKSHSSHLDGVLEYALDKTLL
ncbi:CYTOCHROME P450 72A11-RELATED [Salix viminalis]|uniref:CYTOCHROME P450 72A11-RELATED n=1 Tax=Salix viminalis TaxID=40686 RepID=A0A9Q0U734_SALVM|nr:CYTOCHROME P450 72A11-RELATED [Salix viminalis]